MENSELQAKLKAFAFMLKFGNDLFLAKDFATAAIQAVSNCRILLNFQNSSIIELNNGKNAKVIAQYGLENTNNHSLLAVNQCNLVEKLKIDSTIILDKEQLGNNFGNEDIKYLCLKLPIPKNMTDCDFEFIWLLEYKGELPSYAENSAKLISSSISNALYFQRFSVNKSWKKHVKNKKKWSYLAILIFCIAIMFVPMREKANANFTLKAPILTNSYAWMNGQIIKYYAQDGDFVKKGELIAQYDDSQFVYQKDMALAALKELQAEFNLEEKNSFLDQSKLGSVKLLEAKLDTLNVNIKEAQWQLDKSKIYAQTSGIISFKNGNSNELENSPVHIGDNVFSILSGDGMEAEILLNERDASILNSKFSATLFLHTAPEKAIKAQVIDVAQYPKLTKERNYCYSITVKLPKDADNLRYGMRGIAKLSGNKAPLGYNLFKGIILYFRGL